MAAAPTPTALGGGGQSIVPPEASFEAFDKFPWSKHRPFLLGLIETLGGTEQLSPNPAHQGSSVFCRTVYYRRQTGIHIDIIQYGTFVSNNPSYPSIDQKLLEALYSAYARLSTAQGAGAGTGSRPNLNRQIAEVIAAGPQLDAFSPSIAIASGASAAAPALSWQQNAPQIDVRVKQQEATDAANGASGVAQGGSGGGADAPYPDKFAKVVEALQSGKEVDGIRQIPDTVVRQPGITPVGKMKAPRKPWETASAAGSSSAGPVEGDAVFIDESFPPAEGDNATS